MIRVEFSNLTFGLEADIEPVPNVKSIPLAPAACASPLPWGGPALKAGEHAADPSRYGRRY